ncbi:TetR/AcrR family transcriptional regulator [Aeromicrobium stalagmiti]|uniref:TetR/AcrR family transcriptional regulator n=1 Tax=Aeromicrobium stalagmiti TaxID=2738988 RepID=UPI001568EB52|nr:TetR/AcrR family transcriptional regulator [Aeromicrobium stalagmiti]NRQ48752.1 TetR/AcrR family transcriptional regulator [Aeromicrobium stalagmiti]
MTSRASAETDGRTARWAGHRDRRRAAFVEAAVAVIDEVGPGASVEQIAAAAGVTRQVLYRQFDGRGDLDEAVVEHAATLVYERVMTDLDGDDDIVAVLRRVLDGYLDFIDEHRSLYWFTRSHESERAESQAVDQVKDRLAQVAIAMAEELLDQRGLTAPVPLDTVFAVGLIGMVDASVSRWLVRPGTTSRAQLVDGLVLMLTGAIDAVIPPVA